MLFFDPTKSWTEPSPTTLPEPLDVLFVGAHPDDVEIACGGTIHRLGQQGLRVGIVDLTDGEPTPLSESPTIRWAEAEAAASVLGVAYRRILPLTNRRLFDGFDERVMLAKEFRYWRPKVVVGFGHKTPMASPDHYQAMQITDAAVFYSRLSKWGEHFGELPVHSISRQLYFCLSFEATGHASLEHQFTFDISDSIDAKIESIACYKTQFPEAKRYVFDRVRSVAVSTGLAAGVAAGEVFSHTKPLVASDFLAMLSLKGNS